MSDLSRRLIRAIHEVAKGEEKEMGSLQFVMAPCTVETPR